MPESLRLEFGEALASSADNVYINLQRLGKGGSAETYLVLATSGPHRGIQFAVKVFRRLSKPEWRASFLAESSFLRTCGHPAVMRVFDEGVYLEDHPFVVAEFLPQTLSAVMRGTTKLSEKLSYALQLLSALDYLVSLPTPVVHRDIKPTNVFIKGGSCVLGDFGLMKRAATHVAPDRESLRESLKGMPRNYRTPDLVEYLKGGPLPTPKSDVFQLGLVLAEMFTGKNPLRPFKGSDFESPIELDELVELDDPEWQHIRAGVRSMLAMEPDSRPSPAIMLERWQAIYLDLIKRTRSRRRRL